MNSLKYLLSVTALLMWRFGSAQDSLPSLSAQQVLEMVRQFHPVAVQADIIIDKSKAGVLVARGMFDPLRQTG